MNNIATVLNFPHICLESLDNENPEACLLGVSSNSSLVLITSKINSSSNINFIINKDFADLKNINFDLDIVAKHIIQNWNKEDLVHHYSSQFLANMRNIVARCPNLGKCLAKLEKLEQSIELLKKIGLDETVAKNLINLLPKFVAKIKEPLLNFDTRLFSNIPTESEDQPNPLELLSRYLELIISEKVINRTYEYHSRETLHQILLFIEDPEIFVTALNLLVDVHEDNRIEERGALIKKENLKKVLEINENHLILPYLNYLTHLTLKQYQNKVYLLYNIIFYDLGSVGSIIASHSHQHEKLTQSLFVALSLFQSISWFRTDYPCNIVFAIANELTKLEFSIIEHEQFEPLILAALKDLNYSNISIQNIVISWVKFLYLLSKEEQVKIIELNSPLLVENSIILLQLFESYSSSDHRSCLLKWILSKDQGYDRIKLIICSYEILKNIDIISPEMLCGLDKLLSYAHSQKDADLTKIIEPFIGVCKLGVASTVIEEALRELNQLLEVCDILAVLTNIPKNKIVDWKTLIKDLGPILISKKPEYHKDLLLMFLDKTTDERNLWMDIFKSWYKSHLNTRAYVTKSKNIYYLRDAVKNLSFEEFKNLSAIFDDFMDKPIQKAWIDRREVLRLILSLQKMYRAYFDSSSSTEYEKWSFALSKLFNRLKLRCRTSSHNNSPFPGVHICKWINQYLDPCSGEYKTSISSLLSFEQCTLKLQKLADGEVGEFEEFISTFKECSCQVTLNKSAIK